MSFSNRGKVKTGLRKNIESIRYIIVTPTGEHKAIFQDADLKI